MDVQNHVGGMKTDGGVGMGGEVVEELFAFLHSLLCAFGLLACDGAEGREDGKVDGTRVIKYAANDALDLFNFVGGEGGEVSGSKGRWASLPYCFGWGEYGQCWGLVGVACIYHWSCFKM